MKHLGLSDSEAREKLKRHGPNILPKEKQYSKLRLFLGQFNSPLIFILLIAGAISIYLEHYSDAAFILIVLLINTTVSFYQEDKANSSLQALRKMVKISSRVLRGGYMREVDSAELVPGDVISLHAGDKVPADAELIEAKGLKVNESSLTGEWMAVSKTVGEIPENSPLADRTNMVFMGSIIEEGIAKAIVTETGIKTAIGGIVSLLRETKERKTPLQEKISYLSRLIGGFIMIVIAIVAILGYVNGQPFADIFIASLALAVSAIPAGLLPSITVILVLGMRRILKSNGLVRKLIANETLGSVTVICTDKTGTLTEGKMQVSHILTGTRELLSNSSDPILDTRHMNGLESHILALKAAVLTNDAFIENPNDEFHEWIVRGGPTQRALLVAGTHAGLSKESLEKEYPPIEKMSFTSDAKYAASLHERPAGGRILYVVGAPEVLASKSIDFHVDGSKEKLDSEVHRKLLAKLDSLTKSGLRVVACAHRELPKSEASNENIEGLVKNLTLVGYIALKDPLRADARDSIALTKRAGIRTVLITGDHRLTAQSIASEVGIEATPDMILEGKDLNLLSEKDLREKVRSVAIYARVSPDHKLRIVQALQAKGEVVAMIGDGVNDAPALKAADVGVSVGSGTDVAKEVADIVLLDDSFKTIVMAIEQGRITFKNIRKVFVYLIADDFSELFIFLVAMALGLPLPLLAAQILWINLVEDGLPSAALTTEQETAGIMDEKPRNPNEPILNGPMKKWLTAILFITGIAAFLLFFSLWKITGDLDRARSVVFALMCLDSLVFVFCVRSFKRSIFRKDIFSNRLLVGAALIGLLLLIAALYLPPLQSLLSTQSLSASEWMFVLAMSTAEILLIEWFKKKSFRTALPAKSLPAKAA
ncbi:MAG: HAD-IC family P-type ATPase [bacterium]|nr:HAD-IC family P-type ATPase [bacterium]